MAIASVSAFLSLSGLPLERREMLQPILGLSQISVLTISDIRVRSPCRSLRSASWVYRVCRSSGITHEGPSAIPSLGGQFLLLNHTMQLVIVNIATDTAVSDIISYHFMIQQARIYATSANCPADLRQRGSSLLGDSRRYGVRDHLPFLITLAYDH